MPREYMCQFGDCHETKITITVTDRDGMEQPRFCCREHAALYLLRRAWLYEGQRQKSYKDRVTEAVQENLKH